VGVFRVLRFHPAAQQDIFRGIVSGKLYKIFAELGLIKKMGVVLVVAAGNENINASNTFPARFPNAITL